MNMIRVDTINANCLVAIVSCFIDQTQTARGNRLCFWSPKSAVFYNIYRALLLADNQLCVTLVADDA